jgi:branched-chain amino acid transport system ATP-binding protein
MLRVKSLVTHYGGIQALKGVSLHVDDGEIVALVGANGAGKTTILNTICGLVPASSGEVAFDGRNVTNTAPEQLVRQGLSQVPEGRQLFAPMTVLDNLILGAYQRSRAEKKKRLKEDLEFVYSIFPILRERSKQRSGTLSGGEQQMLAIARALMSKPKMLLLDEPSVGLAPMVAKEIFHVIAQFRDMGTTVLLVEQNARAALGIADRGYVLETGKIILEDTASELMRNKEVQRAYLGKGYRHVWE